MPLSAERTRSPHVVLRALALLRPERLKAGSLLAAGALVAFLQVAEPLLFGKAVNGLTTGANPMRYVGLWCAISVTVFAGGGGSSRCSPIA